MHSAILRLAGALSAILVAASDPVTAQAAGPRLSAVPTPVANSLPPGITRLGNGAVAFRPASLRSGQLSLLILLHGASDSPERLIAEMRDIAERRGLIVYAPKSRGLTWDAMLLVGRLGHMPTAPRIERAFDDDVARIDRGLRELFTRADIDPKRIVIAGHSDGASYAIGLGLWNPRLLRGVVALSPGVLLTPRLVPHRQRIFIAHGVRDMGIPIDQVRQVIVQPLAAAGLQVRLRPFDGGHSFSPAGLDAGLEWVFRQ